MYLPCALAHVPSAQHQLWPIPVGAPAQAWLKQQLDVQQILLHVSKQEE